MMKRLPLTLGAHTLKASRKAPYLIAEIAGAHQGDPAQAIELLKHARKANAHAAKLQKFTAAGMLSRFHPRFSHFSQIQLADSDWRTIIQAAESLDLPLIFDVFDVPSLEFLQAFPNIIAYKLHATDLNNPELRTAVGHSGKPILLGVGGSSLYEIHEAVHALQEITRDLGILAGFQSFPTQPSDLHLRQITALRTQYPYIVGYADHSDADSPWGLIVPPMAASAGAVIIEKHITLNRKEKGIDYYSALEPHEFAHLSQVLAALPHVQGQAIPPMDDAVSIYRKTMKKCIITRHDLPVGHAITEADITYKRATSGTSALDRDKLIGKRLRVPISEDMPLTQSQVEVNTIACIAVRMHSSRLPKKALLKIDGLETVRHLIRRVKAIQHAAQVVLCTSAHPDDAILTQIAVEENIPFVAGSEKDVMSRFLEAAERFQADTVVRVTGDDILIDPEIVDAMIQFHHEQSADYTWAEGLPKGVEAEIMAVTALKRAYRLAEDTSWTEYMTWYIKNPQYFHIARFEPEEDLKRADIRLTMDHPEDFAVIETVLTHLRKSCPDFRTRDIIQFLDEHPKLIQLNQHKFPRRRVKGLNVRLKLH